MGFDVDWRPTVGDPDFIGWFTTCAYLAVAVLCFATRRAVRDRIPAEERGRQAAVWGWAAVLFFLLGVNKELDLQLLMTAVGRAVATKFGWMPERRAIQSGFMTVFVGAAAVSLAGAAWIVRRRRREYGLLLVGLTITVAFVVVRAAEFEHFDVVLHTQAVGIETDHVLELAGIGVTGVAAWNRFRYARDRPPA
jgi:hypothetical protein